MICSPLMFLGAPGWLEILLILVVILLIFGAKKLPEIMGSFGKGVREFKKEIDGTGGKAEDGGPGEDKLPPPDEEDRGNRPGEKPGDGGSA